MRAEFFDEIRKKLQGMEAEYEPSHWDAMREKLDAEDKPKKKFGAFWLNLAVVSILLNAALIGYMFWPKDEISSSELAELNSEGSNKTALIEKRNEGAITTNPDNSSKLADDNSNDLNLERRQNAELINENKSNSNSKNQSENQLLAEAPSVNSKRNNKQAASFNSRKINSKAADFSNERLNANPNSEMASVLNEKKAGIGSTDKDGKSEDVNSNAQSESSLEKSFAVTEVQEVENTQAAGLNAANKSSSEKESVDINETTESQKSVPVIESGQEVQTAQSSAGSTKVVSSTSGSESSEKSKEAETDGIQKSEQEKVASTSNGDLENDTKADKGEDSLINLHPKKDNLSGKKVPYKIAFMSGATAAYRSFASSKGFELHPENRVYSFGLKNSLLLDDWLGINVGIGYGKFSFFEDFQSRRPTGLAGEYAGLANRIDDDLSDLRVRGVDSSLGVHEKLVSYDVSSSSLRIPVEIQILSNSHWHKVGGKPFMSFGMEFSKVLKQNVVTVYDKVETVTFQSTGTKFDYRDPKYRDMNIENSWRKAMYGTMGWRQKVGSSTMDIALEMQIPLKTTYFLKVPASVGCRLTWYLFKLE